MIYISGISIALFIAALLLSKKGKTKSEILLFCWMLVLAFHLFLYHINFTESPARMPQLLGIEIPLPLIHGVFLFLYVAAVTNQYHKHRWQVLLHFLPISMGYIYLFPLLLSNSERKINFYLNGFEGYRQFMQYGLILIFISGIVYVVWSIFLLYQHSKHIRNHFSNLEDVSLRWLWFLTIGMGLVWSIVIVTNNDVYIFIGVSIFVILIGFFGIQQKRIFVSTERGLPNEIDEASNDEIKKYAKSGLKDEVANQTYKDLFNLFIEEKYYKKNDLSLEDLASELNINSNYLSQIINEKEGKSFYDFVNSFRLEAFKQMIKDQQHEQFTLLALAFECGFNSKSSFNRYFKKQTGQTPSEFVKTLKHLT
jgi:AraC-like DNA-binding protein